MSNVQSNIENLKRCIKEKLERSMDSPGDFDYLSDEIKAVTKEYVSPTTLKRFFNYIHSNVNTRTSTLSLLARYLNYKGWDDFVLHNEEGRDAIICRDPDDRENIGQRLKVVKRDKYFVIVLPKRNLFVMTPILVAVAMLLICTGVLVSMLLDFTPDKKINYAQIDDGVGGKMSSIVMFDTLSRMVIRYSSNECNHILSVLDTIPDFRDKSVKLRLWKKETQIHIADYPTKIMDKYMNGSEPEYNLYKATLINIAEGKYNLFFDMMSDSIKTEIVKTRTAHPEL